MKQIFKILCNKLCLLNYYLEDNRNNNLLFLLFSVLIPNLFIITDHYIIGSLLYSLIGIFGLIRFLFVTNKLSIDFSVYDVPNIGDFIVFDKSYNPTLEMICLKYAFVDFDWYKNGQFKIVDMKKSQRDILLYILNEEEQSELRRVTIEISLLKTRKFWNTKSDLREKKLNDILNFSNYK